MTPKLRQVLVTWLIVYPIITTVITFLEPIVHEWSIPLRTGLISAIMVPVLVLWALPFANRRLHRFLDPSATRREAREAT